METQNIVPEYTIVYNDDDGLGGGFCGGESLTLTVEAILEIINEPDCHSDEWTDYDETDWIEGLVEFTDYELHLGKGDKLNWKDPDNGECSCEVEVMEDTIVTGGWGKEITIVPCSNGDHHANELY